MYLYRGGKIIGIIVNTHLQFPVFIPPMDADWFSDEYTYLSENELRFLVEGETDSRPAGTLRADIDAKVEDLDEYLANLINEVIILHAEGYLDQNLALEDLSRFHVTSEYGLPLTHMLIGDFDHIHLGYQFGHLVRTLYEDSTPTDSPQMVLFGFAAALLADHPTEDMYEDNKTEFQWDRPRYHIKNYDSHRQDIIGLGNSYADLIENISYPDVQSLVDPVREAIYDEISHSTVPTKPLQKAFQNEIKHSVSLSEITDPVDPAPGYAFFEFTHGRNMETYDAFAALVEDDIQRINETSPGTLEMRYVLQTIADSDDPNLSVLQELKRRFPKASGKKQQNVARVRNNLLGKKGWKRQFITEGEDRYHLSPYGKFVSTIMFSDDSAHAVCHAHIFDQWEHVTANQDEIEPSLTEAFETVDIPMPDDDDSGEDTDVIDLDGEW
jgi:hypothetical protein